MGHQRRVICNNHNLKRPVAAAELVFVEMLCAQWAGPVLFFIGFGIHLSALFPLVVLHGRLGTLEDQRLSRSEAGEACHCQNAQQTAAFVQARPHELAYQ